MASTETETQVRDTLYIGGEWIASDGGGTIDVIGAATEAVIGTIPEGTPADVERAVTAAAAAFPDWAARRCRSAPR